ncbi:MAG: thioredoxin [Acidobacteriota bacterium]|nr:thioredoxin [Blastocatellia bacterium]MDW8412817.1 thioredoxin [Acidobacteriota bacterium]
MSGNVVEFTDSNFEQEVLKSSIPVLVDFWAPWCGPCQMIAPSINAIAAEFAGKAKIGKLNVDDNQEMAARFGIRSIPLLIVFKNGVEKGRLEGARPKQDIVAFLQKHL